MSRCMLVYRVYICFLCPGCATVHCPERWTSPTLLVLTGVEYSNLELYKSQRIHTGLLHAWRDRARPTQQPVLYLYAYVVRTVHSFNFLCIAAHVTLINPITLSFSVRVLI